MKPNYKRSEIQCYYSVYYGEWRNYGNADYYQHRYRYMRAPRTHLNRKRLAAYPEYVRSKQRNLPSSWDDIRHSFSYGKCWKRFTKKRKQYL